VFYIAPVRLLGIVPAILLPVLLAQVSPPTRTTSRQRDAGVRRRRDAGDRPIILGTDPPGRLRPAAEVGDGGVVERDAGPDEVRRELQALRARIDALEQERLRTQQTAEMLQQLNGQVQQMRQQLADAEARRVAEEQQRETQRANLQVAVDTLASAQQRLISGDYSIDAELDRAQATLTGQAQQDVQAARAAVQNRDLARARALLNAAILDAQAGR
jgi:uncharacterized membrane-anchored protein YhcB (DUF1043 family)